MGFFDQLLEVGASLANNLQTKAAENQARMGKKIAKYESSVIKAENSNGKKSAAQLKKIRLAREKIDNAKTKMYGSSHAVKTTNNGKILYGDRTVNEWDSCWHPIGPLKSAYLTPYNHDVGLYRHRMNGKVMYIGRALELNNGGFRKRLSDYQRESDSARKHTSGRIIFDNLDNITTDILVVGNTKESIQIAKALEPQFIIKYHPEWNKMFNV